MSTPVFPSGLVSEYGLIIGEEFRTLVIGYGGKTEQRIALDADGRKDLALVLLKKTPADIVLLSNFFRARKGKFEAFYIPNPGEAYGYPQWQPSTAYTVGEIVRPNPPNGRSYRCTVAGTTGGSAPTFTTTEGGTVVDGSVTWTENSYLVRFDLDRNELEYFQYQLWNAGQVKLIEVSA